MLWGNAFNYWLRGLASCNCKRTVYPNSIAAYFGSFFSTRAYTRTVRTCVVQRSTAQLLNDLRIYLKRSKLSWSCLQQNPGGLPHSFFSVRTLRMNGYYYVGLARVYKLCHFNRLSLRGEAITSSCKGKKIRIHSTQCLYSIVHCIFRVRAILQS